MFSKLDGECSRKPAASPTLESTPLPDQAATVSGQLLVQQPANTSSAKRKHGPDEEILLGKKLKTCRYDEDINDETAGPSGVKNRARLKYKKVAGCADMAGMKYEFKMAALLFLRGVNRTAGFYLGTNVSGAGAFDDVVFKYKPSSEQQYRTCFLQCKHNSKGNKIILMKNLAEEKGDFSLFKYYKSSCVVNSNLIDPEYNQSVLFDNNFDNCDFVLYTNANIDRNLVVINSIVLERANIFATGMYIEKQPTMLKESTLIEVKAEVIKHLTKKKNVEELREFMDNSREFFGRVQLYTQQAKEDEMDALIQAEIKMALGTSEEDTVKMAKMFVEKMQSWWEEKEESEVLTETAQLWRDVIVSRLDSMNEEMEALDISFTDQEIDSFNQSLSSNVINVTTPHGKLTSLKMSQMLEKHHPKRYIFMTQTSLLSKKAEVLRAWQSVWCDVLVIECSTDAETLVEELIKASPGKKLILLSESALPGYQQHHDSFNWNQLEGMSQRRLLEEKVDFQGCEVSLGSVVGEHCTHALTGEVVTTLISPGAKLAFGKKIPDNISYYINRSLQRSDYIKEEIFSHKLCLEDFFIFSNVKEQDVNTLEDSYRVKLKKFDENQYVSHHFFWTDDTFNADKFTRLCQKIPGKNVHWLSVDQNNDVYWKQSFNNMDVIKKYVDKRKKRTITADDVVNERVVIVAAEPGMGKSTFLNNVAQAAKSEDKSKWAMIINLNDITRHLEEHTEKCYKSLENVTDFLIDAVKCCKFDNNILRSRLTETGNVDIYLDGYDEISPYYNDKVTNMIKSMMKLKVGQIWLTSRNVMRHHLESKLSSICYSMKPFTDEDQVSFLVKFWNAKHSIQIDDTSKEFARNLLKKASESFSDRDREFTGIPLQCMMLGEVFAEDVQRGDLNLPNRLDLLQLFETFISEKLNILNKDKRQIDTSKPYQIMNISSEKKIMMDNHSNAALLLLLLSGEIAILKVDKQKIISNFAENFSDGNEWTGLIDGMRYNNKPNFIHRCFAEYFLAWWLSENISSSTDFIAQKLFERRFVIVRQFLDRLLARDCPLHNAVLSADRERVEALLTSGADVNQLDKEERSALHLASSYPDKFTNICTVFDIRLDIEFILSNIGVVKDSSIEDKPDDESELVVVVDTTEVSIVQLLLNHGADVSLKDRILQRTPLGYADRAMLWGKAEHLIKNKVNTDDLVELKKMINNAMEKEPEPELDRETDEDYYNYHRISSARLCCYSLVQDGCFHLLRFAVDECELDVRTDLNVEKNYTSHLLHAAAGSGREESVKFLLDRGADMMQGDRKGLLPIHCAARAGRTNIMQLLVKSGLDARDVELYTPLHHAAGRGQINTVTWLVNARAELDGVTGRGYTPLFLAVKNKHVEVAKYLIEAGADVNSTKSVSQFNPLHYAAGTGQVNVVTLLVNAGAQLDVKAHEDYTPLFLAVMYRYVEVAKYLIEAGADVNAKQTCNISPLHYAAESGLFDFVVLLVDAGAELDVKTSDDDTPLLLAVESKHAEVAKYLIEAGADVNAKNIFQFSPLHFAAGTGQLITIKWLLSAGAAINAKKCDDDTPLHLAVENEHAEVAEYLIEAGADVNAQRKGSWTPLHYAAKSGLLTVVKLLVEAEAELDAKTVKRNIKMIGDETPLHLALRNKRVEVAKYLIEAGADRHCADSKGNTPADLANDLGPEFIEYKMC